MLKIENKRNFLFEKKRKLINDVLNGRKHLYIFGLTSYAATIYSYLRNSSVKIDGFIDDITTNKIFLNEPVVNSYNLPKDIVIILAIVEGRPKTLYNYLFSMGFQHILDYFDFNFIDPIKFPVPFNNNNYNKIVRHRKSLENIYEKLEDEISKETFKSILDFRINYNYLEQAFTYSLEKQYFESFLDFERIKTFVDAGGYDGATTLKAIELFNNLEKVYYIEPFPVSMLNSKKRLASINTCQIVFLESALSSEDNIKYISDDKGNANHLIDEGKIKVKVSTLDSLINEKIDYLKLDIEGEEVNALKGSESIIKIFKPYIAVCVYHDQDHFWQVPDYLLTLNSSYKLYLRHYTEGICETVMYFI